MSRGWWGAHWDPRLQEDGSGRYGLPCRVMGRKGDAQGAAGPIMVGIQEALAVPRVIDHIVPGGKEKHSLFCLGDIPGRAQEINSWFCTQEPVLPGLRGPSRV